MRIRYAKIVNSIGLTDGLGKDTVEVSFDTNQKIIMLLGVNGSGKSSLLRQLNPAFQKELFIEGIESSKEIHIELDNKLYEIYHQCSARGIVKSIIRVGDKVLNENGGVRTFNEIIKKIFGFTQDYFNIGFAGSDVSGFIEQPKTERKKFVSKFIPNLAIYDEAYKNASQKLAVIKKQVELMRVKLNSYINIDNDKESLAAMKEDLKLLNKDIASCITESSRIKTTVSQIVKSYGLADRDKLAPLLDSITLDLSKQYDILEKTLDSIGSFTIEQVNTDKDELTNKIREISVAIEQQRTEKNELAKQVDVITREISVLNNDITKLNDKLKTNEFNQDEFDLLKSSLDEYTERLATAESELLYPEETMREMAFASRSIQPTIAKLQTVIASDVKPKLTEFVKMNTSVTGLIKSLEEKSAEIVNKITNSIELKNKYTINVKQLSVLDKRPTDCAIDTCPFIAQALEFKDLPEQINVLTNEISNLNSTHKEIIDEIQNFNIVRETLLNINIIFTETVQKLKDLFPKSVFISTVTTLNNLVVLLLDGQYNLFDDILNQVKENDLILNNISSLKANISGLNTKINSELTKQNVIATATANLQTANDQLNINLNKRDELINKISKISWENEDFLLESYKVKESELKTIHDMLNEANSTKAYINTMEEKQTKLTKDIAIVEQGVIDFKQINEKHKDISTKFSIKQQEYDALMEHVVGYNIVVNSISDNEKDFEMYQKLVKTLHPTTGIPLLFINQYMLAPKRITNNLLDVAYGGAFNIDFRITDNEFSIPVSKSNGNTADDILDLSSGQRAMTKSALCLSLVSAFIGKYNILNLDELDAALDAGNRRIFLNILQTQIETLKLDQVFIISHNDEFFTTQDLGLVLFKGHTAPTKNVDFLNRVKIFKDFSKGA